MNIYFSENLKRLRKEKNITQETLADFLGISFQSISRWERGEAYPDITTLPAIASYFNISIDNLLGYRQSDNEKNILKYINLYDNMKLKDLKLTLDEFKNANKLFPGEFRITVRYMQLLHEAKIRTLTYEDILSQKYIKVSEEIIKIYNNIQKHCTDDSIRIWSKTIMISHLIWKYECISDENGKYRTNFEFLQQAEKIINSLPSIRDSKELNQLDITDYYKTHKSILGELIFILHEELFGFCLNQKIENRIKQYESLLNLLDIIYQNSNYEKNSFNRLYDLGWLGQLYHKIDDNQTAMKYLSQALTYAKQLDNDSETSEKTKRYYNYGSIYRDTTATEFMKTIITEQYDLSSELKSTDRFKKLLEI